jgi:hypothetical protein
MGWKTFKFFRDLAENPFRNVWVERKWKNQNE